MTSEHPAPWLDVLDALGRPGVAGFGVGLAYVCAAAADGVLVEAAPIVIVAIVVVALAEAAAWGVALALLVLEREKPAGLLCLATVLAIYWMLLPPLDFRWSLALGAEGSRYAALFWALAINMSAKYAFRRPRTPADPRRFPDAAAAGVCMGLVLFGITSRGATALWGAPATVEAFLASVTPFGSTLDAVQETLRTYGIEGTYVANRVGPGLDYPPSRVGGAGWIHVLVGEHGPGFVTSVEGFYYFDDLGRLVEIRVRKTTDGF